MSDFLRPETVALGRHVLRCEYRDDPFAGMAVREVCDLVGPRGKRGTVAYDPARDRFTLLGAVFGPIAEERRALDEAFRRSSP